MMTNSIKVNYSKVKGGRKTKLRLNDMIEDFQRLSFLATGEEAQYKSNFRLYGVDYVPFNWCFLS